MSSLFSLTGILTRQTTGYLSDWEALICAQYLSFHYLREMAITAHVSKAAYAAAKHNWIDGLVAVLIYCPKLELLLIHAAQSGNIKIMRIAERCRHQQYDRAHEVAAHHGMIRAMRFIRDYSEVSPKNALISAATTGQLAAMRMVKIGVTDFNEAFEHAARGKIRAMKLLRKWGARNYNDALMSAASYGTCQSATLLKNWGANNFNDALIAAAGLNRINMMHLLKSWGATEFARALYAMTRYDDNEGIQLLKKWVAENPHQAKRHALMSI